MRGVPKLLNTKSDVELMYNMAIAGEADRETVKSRIENLLSDEYEWRYKATVDESYSPEENEKVMAQENGDATEYVCFELVENNNSTLKKMGLTRTDVENMITELEA